MRWSRREPLDVLVVCTGNVCRSPFVAARLAADLPGLRVASAGTEALDGDPPEPEVVALLAERGVAAPTTVGRTLTASMVRGARLVLTATARHRVEVVRLDAGAAARAFTLLEAARVLDDAGRPTGLGVDAVAALVARRAEADDGLDHADDLEDPLGRSEAFWDAMADRVDAALDVLVPALRDDAGGAAR